LRTSRKIRIFGLGSKRLQLGQDRKLFLRDLRVEMRVVVLQALHRFFERADRNLGESYMRGPK
jgi:hypothetical protein